MAALFFLDNDCFLQCMIAFCQLLQPLGIIIYQRSRVMKNKWVPGNARECPLWAHGLGHLVDVLITYTCHLWVPPFSMVLCLSGATLWLLRFGLAHESWSIVEDWVLDPYFWHHTHTFRAVAWSKFMILGGKLLGGRLHRSKFLSLTV